MKKTDKDMIFIENHEKKFEFDETVAAVFDDMLDRSIPLYENTLELICSMILSRNQQDISVLDLGSSTARLLLKLHNLAYGQQIRLIGIDNSEAMVERARKKCSAYGADNINLILGDILDYEIANIDVIVANYTLQFIRPMERLDLLKK